jgi:hypothetical protein
MEQTEKMKNYVYKILAAACALVLGGWSIANAVPVLTIYDGNSADTVTVDGGGSGQVSGTAVNIGGWSFTSETGETKPYLGSATAPDMFLSFDAISSSVPGTHTLTLTWSDTGFGPSSGGFYASIGTTTGSGTSVGFATYYNTGNTIQTGPAGGTLLTTISPLSGSSDSSLSGSELAYVAPLSGYTGYSLTEVVTITATQAGVITTGNATLVSVPDAGSTLILLGAAISVLGVFAGFNRRQWNRQWSR